MKKKYFCKQCGREFFNDKHGSTYCRKHGYQIEKYGYCLDSNPRNKFDANEFRFKSNNCVEFDTYKEAWNYAEVIANKMFKKGAVEATISGNGTTDTYDIY